VRHPLVQRIVVAYETNDAARAARERSNDSAATQSEDEAAPPKRTET
jgi:hypothetical protein